MGGLARYPLTAGSEALREAIAGWLTRRHGLARLDREQVLPTLGSREALFAITQTVVDPAAGSFALMPNPFYQIYEGAALLAGATPYFLNATEENGLRMVFSEVPREVLAKTAIAFICSPGNPTGRVMHLDEWRELFRLSDEFGFVIVADECYSEIYFDEANPPLGALAAAERLGRGDYRNLLVMGSLSKRSNVPGMRSGMAAGDAALIKAFLLYRTYHGCAMSGTIQAASISAWNEEAHVRENRRLYREKFAAFHAIVNPVLPLDKPEAAFYYWARTPRSAGPDAAGNDEAFARRLFEQAHVTVLPGSYLSRPAHGTNPGAGFVRIALVSTLEDAIAGAMRIKDVVESHRSA
jgi:N-succinyldiaminopimelate aminotransferase